jgi:predicted RND superfamily exporter protein
MQDTPSTFSQRFLSFIVARPFVTLAIGFAIIAAMVTGLPKVRANFTHTAFFKADDPALLRFEAFERRFGNDDAVVAVVHSPSGIFDKESTDVLRELTEKMWLVSEVIRVDSLSNFQWVHARGDEIEIEPLLPREGELSPELLAERKKVALEHELLPGYLISEDGKSAVVYARIKPGIEAPPDAPKISKETLAAVESVKRGDHEFYLTGGPIMTEAFRASSERDLTKVVPMLLGAIVLLLALTFRSVGGVAMTFIVIFPTVIAAIALSGHLGIEMSSVTFALPQVLIAVCIADAVHLLAGFYRGRRAGLDRRSAAMHTLRKNLVPTLLTTASTGLGFFSFATAKLPPIEGFGILAALGTIVAWLVTYLIVGPLMVLWPGKDAGSSAASTEESLHEATPRSLAFIGQVDRYRYAIMGVFAAAVVTSAVLGTKNIVNSNPYEYFRKGLPIRNAQEFVLEHLAGIASFELVIDSGKEDGIKDPEFLRKVEELEKRALELPNVNRAVSIVDILRQMNRALSGGDDADYKLPTTKEGIAQEMLLYTMGLPQGMDVNDRVSIKNDALRITFVSTITDSNLTVQTAARLESIARELGLQPRGTGKILLYQGMNGHVVQSFLQSLLLALFFIGSLMLVSFRSIKLGLISMIPNVVPLLCGGAVLYFVSGQLDIGTVLVASVCLGIAVDNTIHILTNFRRHVAEGEAPRVALARLFAHAGPAMLLTTSVLVLGFSTLALGDFMPNVYFGVLTSSILTIALLTDFVLLPAILLTLVAPSERSVAHGAAALAE